MLRKVPVLIVPLVLLCPVISHGEQSGPSNFDECIIDAMRGVSSDVAARAIIDSCRNLYPESQRESAPQALPVPGPAPTPAPTAVEDGASPAAASVAAPAAPAAIPVAPPPLDTAGARALTEVTIAVWDDTDFGATREEFSEAVRIAPQTSAMVKYTVHDRGDETGWNWGVVAARGVE